nr:gypsy/Ty3 retroelement polyprotein [Tanacetum cinerariifolium]
IGLRFFGKHKKINGAEMSNNIAGISLQNQQMGNGNRGVLYDKALLWHKQFMKTRGPIVTWEVYKEVVLARFCSLYDDPMSELKNLKYDRSAREYKDAFDNLLSRVEVSQEHALSLFMGVCLLKLKWRLGCLNPRRQMPIA